ncbi:MAG: DUF1269 domain-containing protein [Anaerolineae bacterium]|nr:DUF1269 domain-containing protein [Anaerolineae bacterium]MCB0205629.1 DUF1269 domain-containing protein [Anaerolineae bacterium]
MSTTISIVIFKDEEEAKAAVKRMQKAEKDHMIEVEDAVLVSKDQNGKVHVKEYKDFTTRRGAITGGAIGIVVGAVLGGPVGAAIAAGVVGGVAGAFVGKAVDFGIPKDRIEYVGQSLDNGKAAVFGKIKTQHMDLLRSSIEQGPGELLEFEVTEDAEADMDDFYSGYVGHANE